MLLQWIFCVPGVHACRRNINQMLYTRLIRRHYNISSHENIVVHVGDWIFYVRLNPASEGRSMDNNVRFFLLKRDTARDYESLASRLIKR